MTKTTLNEIQASAGAFYTPQSIAHCMAALLSPRQGTIYDPCCGSGSLLIAAQEYGGKNVELYGQAQDDKAYLKCQMNLRQAGLHADLGTEGANALAMDCHKGRKFDYILANPPFNSANWLSDKALFDDDRWRFGVPPRSNANFAWLQHILYHLHSQGRAAVILPNGTLTTQTCREAGIREELIRSNWIEAIIALPPGLFDGTRVPCCIWLLANAERKNTEVLFVDGTQMKPAIHRKFLSVHAEQLEKLVDQHRQGKIHARTQWYGTASIEAIKEKDFLLSPNLYTAVLRPKPSEMSEYEKLTEIIDEISALPVDEEALSAIVSWKGADIAKNWQKAALLERYDVFGGVTKGKASFGRGCPLLDVKTVIRCPYVPNAFSSHVDVTEEERIKYGIRSGDVLLNRSSETAEELGCCCVALEDRDAVYSGFVKRLRPRGEQIINPLYAACYFRSEIYRWEIEKVSTVYTTYASLDNKKLSRVVVYFPDAEMQRRLGSTVFKVFQYREQCTDERQRRMLSEFERLLIRRYITYPILCMQNKEGDFQCR